MDANQKLKLFSLAEQLSDIGHWSVDIECQALFWSDQVYQIHGVSRETYTPDLVSAIEFYHPDDRQYVSDFVVASIAKGLPFEFSFRIVRRDGEVRHVKSKAICELDDTGTCTGIFGVFRDVTSEECIKQSKHAVEALNHTLIESSNDGFWDWHIQDDYQFMSPRFWEMFGYMPEEKPHKPSAWQDMIFEEDLAVALQNFQRHVDTKGESPYCQEVRYRHKDGSTVTVLCRGKVIEWSADGQPLRMVGSHTDITQLKEAEQKLRRHLDFHTLLMNENKDLIFVKDENFRIVSANAAFLSLYPEDIRDAVIGSTTIEEYNEEQAELFLREDKKAFASGESEIEETILFPDGRERTCLTRKLRFQNDKGTPFILCVARDVTDLKDIEKALRVANEELEEFAYRTSHDLRSPLVSSKQLLKFVKRDIAKQDYSRADSNIDLVINSLGKLENLVTEILQMTKSRFDESDSVLVCLPKIVDDSLREFSHMENFDRIKFTIQCDAVKEFNISRVQLVQVIENLISNAIKYQDTSKTQSTVDISARRDNDKLYLTIMDNGLGIPEFNRDELFSMFKRFHTSVSFGSGLGLYMIKKSVDKMGGEITYTPLEDGTQFTVILPIT